MTDTRSKPKNPVRKTPLRKPLAKPAGPASPGGREKSVRVIQRYLELGQLRSEKCELREAQEAYSRALRLARRAADLRFGMEALAGLLRLAGEAQDELAVKRFEKELDSLMREFPGEVPPMVWYCKGAIARHRGEAMRAQSDFHRYLRLVRRQIRAFPPLTPEEKRIASEQEARGWIILAIVLWQRNRLRRAHWLTEEVLRRYGDQCLRNINGIAYHLLGSIAEKMKKDSEALRWYQKAHASFLGEHSWYYHLYVLYAYARLARKQGNYVQAYWHLDLIDKAASGPEFGLLRREITLERSRLEKDAVDLLIDSRQCVVRTRENGRISLGKQYVLLNILEALSEAHRQPGEDRERGLSKAEIIERVWKEAYRPEAHDNKLYYNINRIRKLIEPDSHKPQYLLNWKEGYRLAPGLRVQFVRGDGPGLDTPEGILSPWRPQGQSKEKTGEKTT